MNQDVAVLHAWVRGCIVIASVCTTGFPVLYAFSPWYRSVLGRALMIQACAFALAMDVTCIFQFWRPGLDVRLSVYAVVFAIVALATAFLTSRLWLINYTTRRDKEFNRGRRRTDR